MQNSPPPVMMGQQQPMMGQPMMMGGQQMMMAPQQQLMGLDLLAPHPRLIADKKSKNWCVNQFCCQTREEFRFHSPTNPSVDIMFAEEQSSCLGRFCCGNLRPFDITISEGASTGGQVIARMRRPFRCHAPSCCCQQEIEVTGPDGGKIGRAMIPFYCFCPKVHIKNSADQTEFKSELECNCSWSRVQFPITDAAGGRVGTIDKITRALMSDCCMDRRQFEVVFPPMASPQQKATILAATFLININFFEHRQQSVDVNLNV